MWSILNTLVLNINSQYNIWAEHYFCTIFDVQVLRKSNGGENSFLYIWSDAFLYCFRCWPVCLVILRILKELTLELAAEEKPEDNFPFRNSRPFGGSEFNRVGNFPLAKVWIPKSSWTGILMISRDPLLWPWKLTPVVWLYSNHL